MQVSCEDRSEAHAWCVQRIDVLLEAVEVEEVAFQAGCQAAELRAVLASSLAQPQRKLSNMHSRIHNCIWAPPLPGWRPRYPSCFPLSFKIPLSMSREANREAMKQHHSDLLHKPREGTECYHSMTRLCVCHSDADGQGNVRTTPLGMRLLCSAQDTA